MVWNSLCPDGAKSVKGNTPKMQQNTTYTESTMVKDHYWNQSVTLDGLHRQIRMAKLTDITLGADVDGGIFLRQVSASDPTIQGFYKNIATTYQFIPRFITGSIIIPSNGYVTVTALPNNSYGNIYLYCVDPLKEKDNMSYGFFYSANGVVEAYSATTLFSGSSTADVNHKFGNGAEADNLNLRARLFSSDSGIAPAGEYQYRIVCWGS